MADMAAFPPSAAAGQPAAVKAKPHKMGLVMATTLVVGNIIGAGIFLLPSSLGRFGGISIVGWLVTAAGSILLALVFSTLARAYPAIGGPYVYARKAFGEFIGFWSAWSYWISVMAGNAAITVSFLAYLGYFLPGLSENRLVSAILGIGTVWALTAVNLRGVRSGGIIAIVTTVLKLLPLLFIALVGIFFINGANFTPFNASGLPPVNAALGAAAVTLFAFIGFESAAVAGDNVENPRRNIPLSTMIGTCIVAVVYILASTAVIGLVPHGTLIHSTAPFADAGKAAFGNWAGAFLAFGACISSFGALNGWILLQAEVPLAAARDNLFPHQFARLNGNDVPMFGMVLSSVFVTLLMLMNVGAGLVEQFTAVILLSTLATLFPYALAAAGELLLFVTDREAFSSGRLAKDVVIASLAFLFTIFAVVGAGERVVFLGFIFLLIGIPVYVLIERQKSTEKRRILAELAVPDTGRQPVPGA